MKHYYNGLEYDDESGIFIWTEAPKYKPDRLGKEAGSIDSNGYRQIYIDNKVYQAHRLAWFIAYGEWPKNQIDHLDRNILNNKIKNLADKTNRQNSLNRKDNTRTPGVRKAGKKFLARIRINYIEYHLGSFETEEEAILAYQTRVRELNE